MRTRALSPTLGALVVWFRVQETAARTMSVFCIRDISQNSHETIALYLLIGLRHSEKPKEEAVRKIARAVHIGGYS